MLSFDVTKYQLVHHTRCSDSAMDQNRTMTIAGCIIKPKESAKYLGVHINRHLNFKEHVKYAVGKGVKAAVALTWLVNMKIGMPHKFIQCHFIGLVASWIEYTLPVQYNPIKEGEGHKSGVVGVVRKLSKPQHLAYKVMAGGLRSTSTDALNYHANMPPTHLRLNLVAYKFAHSHWSILCSRLFRDASTNQDSTAHPSTIYSMCCWQTSAKTGNILTPPRSRK